ncbi:MAG: hypothetical protein MUF42_11035 [Cytophagaceae bacterium]|jgi:hypothetical protein|nr:hypothetical protein [Cytophagaceae bacterium]
MKRLGLLFFLCWNLSVFAQFNLTDICKSWKITAYESFGVIDSPSASQVNDSLIFLSSKKFLIIENGIRYECAFLFNGSVITCMNADKTFSRQYKILKLQKDSALLEYQDSDLIKFKYYLLAE